MAMLLRSDPSAPCLRCVFPNPPQPGTQPTCDTAGVLGPAVATAAAWQAALALRALTHQPPDPILHDGDIWNGTWRSIKVHREPDCPCCAQGHYAFLDAADHESHTFCGSGTIQIWPRRSDQRLDLAALAQRLATTGTVTATPFMVRAHLKEPTVELTIFSDGRALIKGTDDPSVARAAYARYIGN
jgi:adenylyltransferase/sulfurtransferase